MGEGEINSVTTWEVLFSNKGNGQKKTDFLIFVFPNLFFSTQSQGKRGDVWKWLIRGIFIERLFRKNLLFRYDFLVDYGRHKSRKVNSRSLLDSQIHDISGCVCGVEMKILHMGRSGGEKRWRGNEEKHSVCIQSKAVGWRQGEDTRASPGVNCLLTENLALFVYSNERKTLRRHPFGSCPGRFQFLKCSFTIFGNTSILSSMQNSKVLLKPKILTKSAQTFPPILPFTSFTTTTSIYMCILTHTKSSPVTVCFLTISTSALRDQTSVCTLSFFKQHRHHF